MRAAFYIMVGHLCTFGGETSIQILLEAVYLPFKHQTVKKEALLQHTNKKISKRIIKKNSTCNAINKDKYIRICLTKRFACCFIKHWDKLTETQTQYLTFMDWKSKVVKMSLLPQTTCIFNAISIPISF